MMGWHWNQLDHMQIICTWLQTGNHASTSPVSFLQAGCPSCCPTNSVKALSLKAKYNYVKRKKHHHTGFLKPKKAPTNVNGTEIPNQRPSRVNSVRIGTAALLPSSQYIRFRSKNTGNTILKTTQLNNKAIVNYTLRML